MIPPVGWLPIQRPHGGVAFQDTVGDPHDLAQFVAQRLPVRRSPVDVVVPDPLEHDAGETTRATHSGNEELGALAYWLFCEDKPFADAANLPEAIKMCDLISPAVAGELPAATAEVLTTTMVPTPENRHDDIGAICSVFCKSF